MDGLTPSLPPLAKPQRGQSEATRQLADRRDTGGLLCDQDHDYTDEQKAFDGGAMDKFVQSVGTSSGTLPGSTAACSANQVMDYYDGNTVTALWNYAQDFAMSDNSFGTTFGPSAPGAINLVSGDTGDVDRATAGTRSPPRTPNARPHPQRDGRLLADSDAQPYYDDCSTA